MVNAPDFFHPGKESPVTRYGYIGLGMMGSAMAENLIGTGAQVTVYDIDPDPVATAVDLGAVEGSSPAAVAANSDVVSICVPAAEHITTVLEGDGGICEGAHDQLTILIHSTVHPDTIIEARHRTDQWGVALFDACVAGGAVQARAGMQTVLAGGLDEMDETALGLLDIYAEKIIDAGPVGSGAALKIAVNVMTYAQFAAATTSHDLITSTGGNPQALFDAWAQMGQLGKITEQFSAMLGIPAEHITGEFRDQMVTQVGISQKDLTLAMDIGWPRDGMIEFVQAIHDAMPNIYNVATESGENP